MPGRLQTVLLLVLSLALLPGASPEPSASRRDVIRMVDRAVEYYQANGLEALVTALEDPENTAFHDRGLYGFIVSDEGQFVAHGANPRLTGKNLIKLKDQNGVYLFREFVETGQTKGRGWVSYLWLNPATRKLQPKVTLVQKLDPGNFVAVGVYQKAR
ncbi:cache domain-containing protein [Rhodobacteraceae bacterium DSL-40]|uniref:cache domain-containing protein n=1 Tax=Amaricoccus sp. B4 TaxID=3368557 RepID=UPI0013A68BA1